MVYLLIFIVGLVFGSFASVLIHRLHTQQQGILWGRSKCPQCAARLATRDLIPLISFVINQFKCRFCREPIALRYPLLELTMGLGFALTAWLTGLSSPPWLLFHLLMVFVFVILSFYDIFFQEIPDIIIAPAIGIAALVFILKRVYTADDLLIGVLMPLIFFGALFLGSGGRWLGGGDVRIGVLMGILLGWPNIVIGLFLGYLLGAIYSLFGILTQKLTRKSLIPFAPFLFVGTYAAYFWGQSIVEWYLNFN